MAIGNWAPRPFRNRLTSHIWPRWRHANRSTNAAWTSRGALAIVGLFALFLSVCAWPQSMPDGDDFKMTLLGTGSPQPSISRFGPGVLVQAGGQTLLIDCGRGITQRVVQLGVKLGGVNNSVHRQLPGFGHRQNSRCQSDER